MIDFILKFFPNVDQIYNYMVINKTLPIFFSETYDFYKRSYFYLDHHTFIFSLFSFLMCFFATFLILVNNPIYSVISLILVYLVASFMLVFIEVHFLAVLFILVYLGAVVVLFLFIVMMLNIKVMNPLSLFTFIPFFIILSIVFFFCSSLDINFKSDLEFVQILNSKSFSSFPDFFHYFSLTKVLFDKYIIESLNHKFEHLNILAFLLYSHFFVELLVASYVLLLAMVGCIALTLGREVKNLKKQDSMQQILHSNSFLVRSINRSKNTY